MVVHTTNSHIQTNTRVRTGRHASTSTDIHAGEQPHADTHTYTYTRTHAQTLWRKGVALSIFLGIHCS